MAGETQPFFLEENSMEIHALSVEYFSGLYVVKAWEEIIVHFEAMAARKPY